MAGGGGPGRAGGGRGRGKRQLAPVDRRPVSPVVTSPGYYITRPAPAYRGLGAISLS